jgi:hypothetical protein
MMFRTGSLVDSGQFSREKVAHIVDDYSASTRALSSHHWDCIMESCGVLDEEVNPPLDTLVMQEDRRNLYTPSSPIQVSDSG